MLDTPQLMMKRFKRVITKSDLLGLINSILLEKGYFSLSMEIFEDLILNNDVMYRTIQIHKKGKNEIREINSPDANLKLVQTALSIIVSQIYQSKIANYNVFGFLKNKNIVQNAQKHVNKQYVLNMDLSNFFDTISNLKISYALARKPFSKPKNSSINHIMTELVTKNGFLPQGSPASPIFSNLVCRDLDFSLNKFAQKNNLKYTRYADDMTFSTNWNLDFASIKNSINQKCIKHGFKINNKKTRLQNSYQRQIVTGLVVNQKVNVKREYLNTTKAMLHNWETLGLEEAQEIFNKHDKRLESFNLKYVVKGRVDFIGLVLGKHNPIFRKLSNKFWILNKSIDYSYIESSEIKARIQKINYEGEKTARDIDSRLNKIYRFKKFCNNIFLQMEELYKYYFLMKFEGDFGKIGLYFFENNNFFKNQMLDKKNLNLTYQEKVEKGKLQAQKITSFTHIKASILEFLFLKDNYINAGRNVPKTLRWIRIIRNDFTHGTKFLKLTKDEVQNKIQEIYKKEEKYLLKKGKERERTSDEKKLFEELSKINWFQSCPFDEIRDHLESINDIVKHRKKLNT